MQNICNSEGNVTGLISLLTMIPCHAFQNPENFYWQFVPQNYIFRKTVKFRVLPELSIFDIFFINVVNNIS